MSWPRTWRDWRKYPARRCGTVSPIRQNASFDFGVAPLPGNPEPASVLGGGSLYIYDGATDEEKEAAWKLIRFLTTPELLADWSIKKGYVAPRDDSWETPATKTYVAEVPAAEVARKQIPVAVPEFSTYENNRINQLINDAILTALTGSATPQEALDRPRPKPSGFCALIRTEAVVRPSLCNLVLGWLLLAPALVLLVGFGLFPTVATLWDSFRSTPRGRRGAVGGA